MRLQALLKTLADISIDIEITGLSLDSRQVKDGFAFIALKGEHHHGLDFAEQAISKGAIAVIYEPEGAGVLPEVDIQWIAISGLADKLGSIAATFYADPSQQLKVIGITGTNGKTTCSQLLAQALDNSAVIGTLGWGDPNQLMPTLNTTPDALAVQQMLGSCLQRAKQIVAMEVSSHGLEQGRVNGVNFTGAVFTNFSRDHLDFHGSMAEYLKAKMKLFKRPELKFAVLNLDDPQATEILAVIPRSVAIWTYSSQGRSQNNTESIWVTEQRYGSDGIRFDVHWNGKTLGAFTPLLGKFNLDNVLAIFTTLLALGMDFSQAVSKLADLKPICGRMERIGAVNQPTVVVDYAHTPDALEKVLEAVKSEKHLSVVFGCGGNRDQGKRPEMRRIAERYADRVIITDDNPRNEAPEAIIQDIMRGCETNKVEVIHDRASAIEAAISQAKAGDYVVIAGKGHEDYQEINGVKWPFKDQEQVKKVLAVWGTLK